MQCDLEKEPVKVEYHANAKYENPYQTSET